MERIMRYLRPLGLIAVGVAITIAAMSSLGADTSHDRIELLKGTVLHAEQIGVICDEIDRALQRPTGTTLLLVVEAGALASLEFERKVRR